MLYLTKLHLENYCGYTHSTFNFKKPDGSPYKFICLFGPNGCGKSSMLHAISLLTANQSGRSKDNIKRSLRKYVKNKDYNPTYEKISGHIYKNDYISEYKDNSPEMIIEGTYEMNGNSYVVRLTQDGFDRNDLAPKDNGPGPWGDDHLYYRQRIAHWCTADNDLSMSKFQLRQEQIDKFEKITSTIMRFPTKCLTPFGIVPMDKGYLTDFTLLKRGDIIHYKRMSAGEQKISTAFAQLLNLIYDLENPESGDPILKGWPRLLLIDNVEMHIYYDRHVDMIQCLITSFPSQQIFTTTHSGVLIPRFLNKEHNNENELYINLDDN